MLREQVHVTRVEPLGLLEDELTFFPIDPASARCRPGPEGIWLLFGSVPLGLLEVRHGRVVIL